MALSAGYGFIRGLVKTQDAQIRESGPDLVRYSRPIMIVERISVVCCATAFGAFGGSPIFLLKDLYDLEHRMRGYKKYESENYSVLSLALW